MVDLIVDRREMKTVLARVLQFMGARPAPVTPPPMAVAGAIDSESPS
jgi:acetyl-CoA carboxylase beta subunit